MKQATKKVIRNICVTGAIFATISNPVVATAVAVAMHHFILKKD